MNGLLDMGFQRRLCQIMADSLTPGSSGRLQRNWILNTTSRTRYPQNNGHAENAVKTVKKPLKKVREVGHTEYQALPDWRNTPTEEIRFSPAQRLFGRCCSPMPTTQQLLKPIYTTKEEKVNQAQMKGKQKWCYNQHVKHLQPLQGGDTVLIQLPGDQT